MYLIFLRMLALTFLPISTTLARVTNRVDAPAEPLVAARIASKQGSLFSHLRNVFFKRDEICVKDDFYYYLQSNPEANTFCNIWISIPPATTMVEYTSTITATDITTTSTNTVVDTVRTTTVFTVTATETVAIRAKEKREDAPAPTDPPLLRRNVLLNGIAAVVTDAIGGTVASSADMPAGTAKASIDAGLSSACSCLNYQPLSTFTVTYTDLPYYTTLDAFEQDTLTLQSTIIQTSYTTQTTTQTTIIGLMSSISLAPSSSPLNSTASAATYVPTPLNNTAPTSSVLISSSSLTAAASSTASIVTSITVAGGPGRPSSEARAIATSLPISCPQNNNQTITNIIGNKGLEYLVLCGVNVFDNTTILSTSVAGPTECAAECSFVNDAFQEDLCQSAVFIPAVGGNDNCVLKKSAEVYAQTPGYVSFILLKTFAGGSNSTCSANVFAGASSSVDTSSLIASITSAGLTVTQPPYAVSTGGGGQFSTHYSHGETDSAGVYDYSWYNIEASSSSWYLNYAFSWTCIIIHPQTIVIPRNVRSGIVEGSSMVIADTDITTIIHGSTTTIIDGGSTIIITNVNGQASVPALVTSGGGVFSTGGSSLVMASQGGSSVISPAPVTTFTETVTSPVATATIISISTAVSGGASGSGFGFGNTTSVATVKSVLSGAGGETTSGGFYNVNSTGGVGAISPSASASSVPNKTTFINKSDFTVTSVISGMTSFYTSTEPLGVVSTASSGLTALLPPPSNGPTGPANQTAIVITTVISGVISKYTFTGGGGVISPTSEGASASTSSLPTNQTVVTVNETTIVYTTVISGATSTYLSTGDVGVVSPSSSLSIIPTSLPIKGTSAIITETVQTLTAEPSSFFSGGTSGGFSTMNSTGGIGATTPTMSTVSLGPVSTLSAILSNGTSVPMNGTVLISTIVPSEVFSGETSGGFSTMNSAGGIGVITPPALSPSTAASAVPSNGTAASMNETALISTSIVSGGVSGVISGNTIVINSTGGVGVISPTSSQSTIYTPTPVNGATASLNKTTSVTSIFISGITTLLSATSESEIQPLPSGSPSVTLNLTIASPEITTFSGTAPPSMAPTHSVNTSTSSFTFSDHPDSRGYSPGSDSSSAFNYTSIVGTRVIVSTMTPSGTAFSPSRSNSIIASTGTPVVLNGTTSSEASLTTLPGSNSIFMAGTGITSLIISSGTLSLTLASISGNGTTAFPTAPHSSSFTFNNGGDSRIGIPSLTETPTPTPFANPTTQVGSDSISILPSASISIPNPNSTMPLSSGPVSALPSTPLPTPFANFTTPINTGSVIILSSNSSPTPSANFTPLSSSGSAPILSSTPGLVASANSTMPLGSGSALTIPSTSIYAAPLNSTTLLGTGSTESASAPSLFENSTAVFGGGSIPTIPSTSIPPSSTNSTASSGTGSTIAATPTPLPPSAMPSSSGNVSINVNSISSPSSSLIAGVTTSASPSSTSTVLSNATSSSECRGSATLSIETVFITHTVPASTYSSAGGFSSQTHGPISIGSPSTNSSTWSEHRVIGEVATQAQINAACANSGNLIFNGDFEIVDGNNNAIGWDSYSRSSFIDFEDYPSTTQHTPGGSYNGRVVNIDPGASVSIWQPVTLCPNGSYYLEAWDRQYPLLAECVVSYVLGNQTVFSTSPQEAWGAQKVIYTAGETAAAVSLTFNITVTCSGPSGKLSEDVNREMIAEIDDLSLIAL